MDRSTVGHRAIQTVRKNKTPMAPGEIASTGHLNLASPLSGIPSSWLQVVLPKAGLHLNLAKCKLWGPVMQRIDQVEPPCPDCLAEEHLG